MVIPIIAVNDERLIALVVLFRYHVKEPGKLTVKS